MGDTSQRVAGTASLSVGGKTYPLRGDFGYRVATVARSSIIGQDGYHGYKEMPQVGQITATLSDAGGLSVAAINAMTNVTVTAQLANGKLIVGRNMNTVGEGEDVKSTEATFEVKWEGPDVSEN